MPWSLPSARHANSTQTVNRKPCTGSLLQGRPRSFTACRAQRSMPAPHSRIVLAALRLHTEWPPSQGACLSIFIYICFCIFIYIYLCIVYIYVIYMFIYMFALRAAGLLLRGWPDADLRFQLRARPPAAACRPQRAFSRPAPPFSLPQRPGFRLALRVQ